MLETTPPVLYWNDTSYEIVQRLVASREKGLKAYFTMDAGPQVKIMCLQESISDVESLAKQVGGVEDIRICSPASEDARLVDSHLF